MDNKINKPIFETNLTVFDKFLVIIQLGAGVLGIGYFSAKFTRDDWGGQIFILCFFAIWIIQVIRVAKTFHLYQDRLIIKRPFFFTKKTNVIFRKIKGRFGGPHIIIKAKRLNESYRIDFSNFVLDDFITQLQKLGIKSSKENLD
ncbi:hypothetical protein EP331_00560 [bacterium]|nr:MAG: hypothetical protein EP331_00560 [bacterium]